MSYSDSRSVDSVSTEVPPSLGHLQVPQRGGAGVHGPRETKRSSLHVTDRDITPFLYSAFLGGGVRPQTDAALKSNKNGGDKCFPNSEVESFLPKGTEPVTGNPSTPRGLWWADDHTSEKTT